MSTAGCNLPYCEGVYNCIVPEADRPEICREWKEVCTKFRDEREKRDAEELATLIGNLPK